MRLWRGPNSKHQIPAFAEAASRRQAKFETSTNVQNPNFRNEEKFRISNLYYRHPISPHDCLKERDYLKHSFGDPHDDENTDEGAGHH